MVAELIPTTHPALAAFLCGVLALVEQSTAKPRSAQVVHTAVRAFIALAPGPDAARVR